MTPRRTWLLGLGLAALIVAALAPFASEHPDTLERTLATHGTGAEPPPATGPAPMPDYRVPALGAGGWSTVVAGCVGLGAVVLLVRLLVRPRRAANPSEPRRP